MAEFWYFVGHERSGRCCDVVASSPAAACRSRGWAIRDCVVIEIGKIEGRTKRTVVPHESQFPKRLSEAPAPR